jgi:hypothetical protein
MKAEVTTPKELKSSELLAVGFIDDARAYVNAAEQLVDFDNVGPRYFLFCHALELALKAYILASGGNQKELQAIRHDLMKGYDRALALGYKPADTRTAEIVAWLNPYHRDHMFRYKTTGLRILPTGEDLTAVCKSMLNEIRPITRAAYLATNQQ